MDMVSSKDIDLIITQILNVTAHLHSLSINLDHLDLSTVLIKGNLIKLTSFGCSLITFKDKKKGNDLKLIV